MVSIHKIKNREGVEYVRMYEGWRENGKVKTAVVKNFGRLDKHYQVFANKRFTKIIKMLGGEWNKGYVSPQILDKLSTCNTF
jgi:hypothetical protein